MLFRRFWSLTCAVSGIILRPRSYKLLAYLTNRFAVASVAPAGMMETSASCLDDLNSLLILSSVYKVPRSLSDLAQDW
jgi:hypothetical protein